jgi:hypothetical protein
MNQRLSARMSGSYSYGNPRTPRRSSHSNTGIVGVYETIKWVRYYPRYCFRVQLWTKRPEHIRLPVSKCIYYGRKRSRYEALQIAINLRKSLRTVL